MKLLRWVLYLEAAELLVWAVVAGLFPSWLTETLLDQPPMSGYGWVRMSAVQAFGFAVMYALVAAQVETRWWFAWAFVITAAGIAAVALLTALSGLLDDVSPRLWLTVTVAAAVNAAALLVGLAKTGLERPAT